MLSFQATDSSGLYTVSSEGLVVGVIVADAEDVIDALRGYAENTAVLVTGFAGTAEVREGRGGLRISLDFGLLGDR